MADNLALARELLDRRAAGARARGRRLRTAQGPLSHARAAVRPCASSRFSRQASRRDTGQPRAHRHQDRHLMSPGNPFAAAIPIFLAGPGRPRQRSSEPASCKAHIGLGPLLSGHRAHHHHRPARDHSARPSSAAAPRRARSNPHSARGTVLPHFPRVPSLEAFGRRPRCSWHRLGWGRHPKPFYMGGRSCPPFSRWSAPPRIRHQVGGNRFTPNSAHRRRLCASIAAIHRG